MERFDLVVVGAGTLTLPLALRGRVILVLLDI